MNKKLFNRLFKKHYSPIKDFFGLNNHHINIKVEKGINDETSEYHPYAETTTNGWYKEADMIFYYSPIKNEEELVNTIFHECLHLLLREPNDSLGALTDRSWAARISGVQALLNDSATQANELLVSHLTNCLLKHYIKSNPLEKVE